MKGMLNFSTFFHPYAMWLCVCTCLDDKNRATLHALSDFLNSTCKCSERGREVNFSRPGAFYCSHHADWDQVSFCPLQEIVSLKPNTKHANTHRSSQATKDQWKELLGQGTPESYVLTGRTF
jgi:hypothetical protein